MRGISILSLLHLATSASALDPTATIEHGIVIGKTVAIPTATAPINQFLGVPFAAPPVRFGLPQNSEPWSTPLEAKEFKPACYQQFKCK